MIWFARVLSFSVGFLSLSQEILWVRLVSFATGGLPQAFGYVLGSFLVGIALGAMVGKRFCERSSDLWRVAGLVLVFAGLVDLALPWLAIQSLDVPRPAHLVGLAFFIATSAFLKSILFPIAHHLGTVIDGDKVGVSVSRVYFANILGATTGPLITGLLLLQWMSLQANFVAVGLLTAAAGLACLARSWKPSKLLLPAAPVAAAAVLALQFPLVANLIQREHPERGPINFVLQNRYGIVHTRESKQGGDWVYGGNTYDGRVNTDLLVDSNGIRRVYMLAALHPRPANVLQIGLGSGSWMEVLAGFPGLESLDVVEINPGYAELVDRYPGVRAAEALPEVHMNWDDGRKWLDQHPERRFDLIVVNTTFYWRAYTTMLLSKEFMSLARSRLAPGVSSDSTAPDRPTPSPRRAPYSRMFTARRPSSSPRIGRSPWICVRPSIGWRASACRPASGWTSATRAWCRKSPRWWPDSSLTRRPPRKRQIRRSSRTRTW